MSSEVADAPDSERFGVLDRVLPIRFPGDVHFHEDGGVAEFFCEGVPLFLEDVAEDDFRTLFDEAAHGRLAEPPRASGHQRHLAAQSSHASLLRFSAPRW